MKAATLSLRARGLLLELRGQAHYHGNPIPFEQADPARLAPFLRATRRDVAAALKEIRDAGLLVREEDGERLTLFEAEDAAVATMTRHKAAGGRASGKARRETPSSGEQSVAEPSRAEHPITEQRQSRAEAVRTGVGFKEDDPEDLKRFEAFWDSYPNKAKRDLAFAEWRRLQLDDTKAAELMQAIERLKASDAWIRERGRFIPLPDNFLRDRRWEDRKVASPRVGGRNLDEWAAEQRRSGERDRAKGERPCGA